MGAEQSGIHIEPRTATQGAEHVSVGLPLKPEGVVEKIGRRLAGWFSSKPDKGNPVQPPLKKSGKLISW